MTGASRKQLVLEIERVQRVRRCIPTFRSHCSGCRAVADLVDLTELARLFDVSIAEATLQLRARCVHLQHLTNGNIVVCAESLLMMSSPDNQILTKSLPPGSARYHGNSSN